MAMIFDVVDYCIIYIPLGRGETIKNRIRIKTAGFGFGFQVFP